MPEEKEEGTALIMKSRPAMGYICVIAAAILWASSGTSGKVLFLSGITPLELVQMRVTLSTVFILGSFALFRRNLLLIRIRDIGYFVILGSLAMALLQLSYFYAISKIQVSAAILLEYMAPALIALYSICFWKERFTAIKVIALLLCLAGCYLVVGGYDLQILKMNREGIAWGLISAFAFAGYTLIGERGMHRYSPWTVIFYAMLFASLTLNIMLEPLGFLRYDYDTRQWWYIMYIVVMGTIIPFGLYFIGINHIRSTRASITATLEPIAAAFMAFFLLGEIPGHLQVLGGIMVISAIVLLQLQKEHDDMSPYMIRYRKKVKE